MAYQGGYPPAGYPPQGGYPPSGGAAYLIISQMHNLAMDIEGGNAQPGAKVACYSKHGGVNQQFYDDPATGTIRSKLNGFCLDIEGDGNLRMMPFQQGDPNQQWFRDQNYIRNRTNNKVLDVFNQDRTPGAKIGMWDANNGANQHWNFEPVGGGAVPPATQYTGYPGGQQATYPQPYQPPQQSVQRQNYVIVSEMNGKVLDVEGGNTNPGAHVIVWDRHVPPTKNQTFYTDPQGFLRSALNDFALDGAGGQQVSLQPFNGGANQQWVIEGNTVRNRSNGEVLDISGGSQHNGAKVLSYRQGTGNNQRWRFDRV